MKTRVTAPAGQLPKKPTPRRRRGCRKWRSPRCLGNNHFPGSSSGQDTAATNGGLSPGLPPSYSWLLRLTGHKMGSEPGKWGQGATREGCGHKIPERGGLRSLSRAAPCDTPVQKGSKYTGLRGHLSPPGNGQQRDCGPEPSTQMRKPGFPGELRERRLGQY